MPLKKVSGTLEAIQPQVVETAVAVAPPVVVAEPPKAGAKMKLAPAKSTGETMSKADWAAKDVRISRQGLYQAALQSPGLMQFVPSISVEEYLKAVERAAEAGLEFVNRA